MKILNLLLQIENTKRTNFHIIAWWEIRRILFNIILIVSITLSFTILYQFVNLGPSEDLIEPLVMIGYILLWNLIYTVGWLLEISMPKSKVFGPKAFKMFLLLSVGLAFIPTILNILFWALNGFNKV